MTMLPDLSPVSNPVFGVLRPGRPGPGTAMAGRWSSPRVVNVIPRDSAGLPLLGGNGTPMAGLNLHSWFHISLLRQQAGQWCVGTRGVGRITGRGMSQGLPPPVAWSWHKSVLPQFLPEPIWSQIREGIPHPAEWNQAECCTTSAPHQSPNHSQSLITHSCHTPWLSKGRGAA